MFKRMLLGVTMLAAMGVGGLGISSTAAAHGCDYGYGPAYRTAYYPAVVPYYDPQVVYYPGSYATFRPVIVDTHSYHHHHHGGVTLSVGF
jgi:hypothetical protein